MESTHVTPYNKTTGKKRQVEEMFDNIAPSYDFLNHLLSVNIDKLWRRKATKLLRPLNPQSILDVATGTGDFAIELMKLKPKEIVGVDISEGMLEVGRKKMKERNLSAIISLQKADSEQLPFTDNRFDAVTVAFGVRNFENLRAGLQEMHRVIKPGGKAVILEFSKPTAFPVKQLFGFYFKYILPVIGRLFSSDKRAYTYLPESVQAFPEGAAFVKLMEECGYKAVECKILTFGIASIYTGVKG